MLYNIIAVLPLVHPAILREHERLDCPRLARTDQRERSRVGLEIPAHERRQVFNRILLDLENDFYVEEVEAGVYDFAGGVLKLWWRKYHA